MEKKMLPLPEHLQATLAHHDAAIKNLSTDMAGLKIEVKALDTSMSAGFAGLSTQLANLNARPSVNGHQLAQTIYHLVVLFSMVVGGIVYITVNQNAAFVATINAKLDQAEAGVAAVGARVGWYPEVRQGKK